MRWRGLVDFSALILVKLEELLSANSSFNSVSFEGFDLEYELRRTGFSMNCKISNLISIFRCNRDAMVYWMGGFTFGADVGVRVRSECVGNGIRLHLGCSLMRSWRVWVAVLAVWMDSWWVSFCTKVFY